jgi:hypothetical protein
MSDESRRLEHLHQLRESVLEEMEAAEGDLSRLRVRVERMESDQRIGRPFPASYQEAKGRLLPQAESRLIDLYRQLLKLEDKINAARGE